MADIENRDELAVTYAALILHDDKVDISADNITKILAAANLADVPNYWPGLFAGFCEGRNLDDLIMNVGSAPAPAAAAAGGAAPAAGGAPAKEEAAEESEDEDMGFGLFD